MMDEIESTAQAAPPPAIAPEPHQLDTKVKYAIAGIALAATLVGSLIGAVGSIYVANRNAETQTSVAQYNFLHAQRQAAYSKFATDLQIEAKYEDDCWQAISDVHTMDPTLKVAAQVLDFDTAYNTLGADINTIDLIGSPAVIEPVHNIEADSWRKHAVCGSAVGAAAANTPLRLHVPSIQGDFMSGIQTIDHWMGQFKANARAELGADGPP